MQQVEQHLKAKLLFGYTVMPGVVIRSRTHKKLTNFALLVIGPGFHNLGILRKYKNDGTYEESGKKLSEC